MVKKDKSQIDLEEAIEASVREVDERIHGRIREAVERREENPRDIVAERVNPVTGEVTYHRVPLRMLYLDNRGHEVLDSVPVAPPVSVRPLSTFEQIQVYNRHQRALEDWPDATLEDEDNFDIPDDPVDPNTQWEMTFEVASIAEINARAKAIIAERRAQQKASNPPSDGPRTPEPPTPSPSTAPAQKPA